MEDETHLDTFLGCLEVDDVPNRIQVLQSPDKHHVRRETQGERKRRRRAGSRDEDGGQQVSAGTQSFSIPGSDDDEGAEIDKEAWRDKRSKTHIGLDVLVLQVEPVRRAQKQTRVIKSVSVPARLGPHRETRQGFNPDEKKKKKHIRMLPDIDPDDGHVRGQDRILILGGDDLELAVGLVVGLEVPSG
jgi:hypothetical protein